MGIIPLPTQEGGVQTEYKLFNTVLAIAMPRTYPDERSGSIGIRSNPV